MSDQERFPNGKFRTPAVVTPADRADAIRIISEAPAKLRSLVEGMTASQLDTPYREGGWTVRQVIHHLPDSHMNAYVRFKLALTEDEPTIKPYREAAWAELADTAATPPEVSLTLLESLHQRWVILLRGLSEAQWEMAMQHPERGRLRLDVATAMYAWHSDHHLAHIKLAAKRF